MINSWKLKLYESAWRSGIQRKIRSDALRTRIFTTKNRFLHFNESYCRFDGVNIYQFRRTWTRRTKTCPRLLHLIDSVTWGKRTIFLVEKMYHFESTFVKSVFSSGFRKHRNAFEMVWIWFSSGLLKKIKKKYSILDFKVP